MWDVTRSRPGVLAFLIFFLPIGSGSAQNLWSAVADDWHAAVETVELVNGVLSGLIAAAGCLIGGHICDRMDRRTAYLVFGIARFAR